MPLSYKRSDIYVEELDLSQSVETVSVSTGGIVFASSRGPKERQLITNITDFIFEYGEPNPQISFGHYCSLAFLAVTNQLWCVRALGDGYLYGGLALQKRQTPPADARPVLRPDTDPNPDAIDFATVGGAGSIYDNLAFFYARGPGSYSQNIAIEIVSSNLNVPSNVQAVDFATVGPIIVGVDAAGSINPGSYQYVVTAQNAVGETVGSTLATVTITVTGTSVYVSWDPVTGAQAYNIYGRQGVGFGYIATVGGGTYYYIDRGTITPNAARQAPTTQVFTDEFTVRIYDLTISSGTPQEQYECSFLSKINELGQQLELEQAINPYSRYIRVQSNAHSFIPSLLPTVFGIAATPLAAGDSGAAVTSADIKRGWDQLREPEDLELRLLINGGYATPDVQIYINQIARYRQDCVAVLDTPSSSQQSQQAIDYRNIQLNLNSNRSALYAPDVLISDPYNNQALYVPPSGHVAAVYAFTDQTTYPWRAPAGLNRGLLDVLGMRYKYNKAEMDNLWSAQVNYVRNFPGMGRAVWEQRTLQAKLSGFSFMNVRRLMDFLEINIARACRFQQFEPNNELTRLQIKTLAESILEAVKNAAGVNSYLVVCDARNNQAVTVAQGQLNVDVWVEPTLPAEKIRIRGILTQQGADFEELIANGALF